MLREVFEPRRRHAHLLVIALAFVAGAVTVNRATYSASITDSSGYIAEAEALRSGRLFRPVPLQLIPAIRDSGATLTALGFRRGLVPGTEVPLYPLGYPMLMAAAAAMSGSDLAMFLVAPLGFVAFIIASYLLADRLAGSVAGVTAAVMAAANPIAFVDSVYPMSDVPAAASWLLSLYFASITRGGGGLARLLA